MNWKLSIYQSGIGYFWRKYFFLIMWHKCCPKKLFMKPRVPSPNGISWTYTALIMVFWCQRKTVRLFLKVKISFSVWAMIVLGGELASEVSRRRTELASKPSKTLMANTENDIWTLRNTPNCSLFGNRNTIIRRCRSKTKLSWVIKPEKNVWPKNFFWVRRND